MKINNFNSNIFIKKRYIKEIMVIIKYLNELLAKNQDHVLLRILRCGDQTESNYGNVVMRILKDYDKDAQIGIT